jgi:hypothetical protein
LKAHHEKIDPEFPDMSTSTFEKRKEGLKDYLFVLAISISHCIPQRRTGSSGEL